MNLEIIDNRISGPNRPAEKWLVRLILALLIAPAVLLGLAQYVIMPAVIRTKVTEALQARWDGAVQLADVDFEFPDQVRLRDLKLLDHQGRTHLHLPAATMKLRSVLSSKPIVTNVELIRPELNLYLSNRELVLPIREYQPASRQMIDLDSLTISDASLSIVRDDRRLLDSVSVEARLVRQTGGYGFALAVTDDEHTSPLSLSGTISRDAASDADVIGFSAELLGGQCSGRLTVKPEPGASPGYSGSIMATKLNLSQIPQNSASTQPANKGLVTVQVSFAIRGGDINTLKGHGLVLLEKMNPHTSMVLNEILHSPNGSNGTISNVEATFTLDGPVATIQDGLLTDRLRVMKAEKGGRVNWLTKELDIHLMTLQLRGVSNVMANIPMVGIAAKMSQQLTRYHVTGPWDDPSVKQALVEDAPAASLRLFAETARTGGQMTPGMHGMFMDMFNTLPSTFTRTPATVPSEN